jgi:hypothetical protein
MGRLSDRRKSKKPKVKPPVHEPAEMAMAFAGAGGVPALIAWAKTNERTRTAFYTLYAKTIPMAVMGEVHATVEGGDAAAALERALLNILDARRRQDEAAGVVIDAQANPGVVDNVTYTRSTNAVPADDGNVVRLHAAEPAEARPAEPVTAEVLTPEQARQRAMAPLPRTPSNELSTTEKFYEYSSDWWSNLPGKI